MSTKREFLIESRDFWRGSADHDKRQLKLSLGAAGIGLVLAGAGIGSLIFGEPGGALELGVGGAMTFAFGQDALEEQQNLLDSHERVTVRQHLADQQPTGE